jgi:hypothetical protein
MSKYTRQITQTLTDEDQGFTINVDVYDVLRAFSVTDPAIQHAIKKLLCTGIRGHKDSRQDLGEAIQSIQRALDAVKVEELLNQPIDAEFEVVPELQPVTSDDSPQPECPFKIGDIIQHNMDIADQAGTKWQIVGITSEQLLVVNFHDHNDASHIERRFWRNYSRVGPVAPEVKEQAECPFRVGDVIQFHDAAVSKTLWKIDRILSDRLHVISHDPYQTPSQIDRQFWPNYRIVTPTTIDAIQQTC